MKRSSNFGMIKVLGAQVLREIETEKQSQLVTVCDVCTGETLFSGLAILEAKNILRSLTGLEFKSTADTALAPFVDGKEVSWDGLGFTVYFN